MKRGPPPREVRSLRGNWETAKLEWRSLLAVYGIFVHAHFARGGIPCLKERFPPQEVRLGARGGGGGRYDLHLDPGLAVSFSRSRTYLPGPPPSVELVQLNTWVGTHTGKFF